MNGITIKLEKTNYATQISENGDFGIITPGGLRRFVASLTVKF